MPPLTQLKSQVPRELVCLLVGYKPHCPRGCSAPALEKQLLPARHQQAPVCNTMCSSGLPRVQDSFRNEITSSTGPSRRLCTMPDTQELQGELGWLTPGEMVTWLECPHLPGTAAKGRPDLAELPSESTEVPGCREGHWDWVQGKSSSQWARLSTGPWEAVEYLSSQTGTA